MKAASSLHLLRVSPALHPPERPSHTHTPKRGFGGRGYESISTVSLGSQHVAGTCMVTHIARVWINRVRLSILHVVSRTGKMNISLSAFVPENLASRDGFGSPFLRQPAHLHTQAESGAYLRFLPSSATASIYLFKTTIRHRVSPEFIGSRNWVPMAFTAESPPAQGQ